MKRIAAASLSVLALGGAGAGVLASAGASPIFAAPYRSGKPATQQLAPSGLYADVPFCPTATGAENAAIAAQGHGPFICGA